MMQHRRAGPVLDGQKLRFILSAGRTGTVFLSKMLAGMYPQHSIVHEPPSSRRTFMLANAEAAGWIPEGTALRLFTTNRARVLDRLPEQSIRVEINPFLYPLATQMCQIVEQLHVIHLVRDPRSWIQSMANFGAASWRRHLIDYVPFARAIHPTVKREWHTLDTISQFAWRWRLANEQLLACSRNTAQYSLIRYEDLFSSDRSHASESILRLLSILPPQSGNESPVVPWETRVNPGRKGKVKPWQQWPRETLDRVMEICGPLQKELGYTHSEGQSGRAEPGSGYVIRRMN